MRRRLAGGSAECSPHTVCIRIVVARPGMFPLVDGANESPPLVTATKRVADAIFQAQSQSWAGATVHYSMLRRLGKTDGSVAKALEPVTAQLDG
jgi:hypothetical protein